MVGAAVRSGPGGVDRERAEQALVYGVGSQVERGYARRDALECRREVMDAWGGRSVDPRSPR